jgi:hypothetical protein
MLKMVTNSMSFAVRSALVVSLAACAGTPADPTSILVGIEEITVLRSTNELMKFLSEQKIENGRLQPEADAGYERIGKVIYAMTRGGIKIEDIDLPGTK